jgi:hypothetical protein
MVIAALFTIAKLGNSPHTQQVISGLRKYGIYTPCSIIPQKRRIK